MVRLGEIQERVRKLLDKEVFEDDGLDLVNDEGLGIVLDSGDYAGVGTGWSNYEIHTIYPNLWADTNLGYVNLVEAAPDEDDWYTIEDVVSDLVNV